VVKKPSSRLRRERAAERGTTLFVVVLVITMLTGIGLYTVHSAALLARASGNERQATQTEYLAQLGTYAALSQLSIAPSAYIPQALSGTDDCRMNLGLDTTTFQSPPCLELSSSSYTLQTGHSMFDTDTFGTALDPKKTTPTPLVGGRFLTEVTDVSLTIGPVTGMDAVSRNAFHYYEAKLTTIAVVQPAAAGAACVENVMQVAGQHMTRAHVLVGPVGGT
jgi:hypothetical protein